MAIAHAVNGRVCDGDGYHAYLELCQLGFDGATFQAGPIARAAFDELLPGTKLVSPGLGTALVDGEDLLLPFVAESRAGGPADLLIGSAEGCVSGIARWHCGPNGWRPIAFTPVGSDIPSSEPSLIRDMDGALLFTARPEGEHLSSVLIWRSADGGESWKKIIDVPKLRQPSPVTLQQAADGTPYVACNQSFSAFINCRGHLGAEGYITFREVLCLWPLNAERASLLTPYFVRIPRYEFGPPRHGNEWYVDHPVGATLRLGDGQWHHLLCYRIMAIAEGLGQGFPPTPHSGLHVSEIMSAGPTRPPWNF